MLSVIYEQRMHCWVQVLATEAKEPKKKGEIPKGSGYKYTNSEGVAMVEFHCDMLPERGAINNNLGGNLSVCFPIGQKPLVMFGHKECIFNQCTMTGKQWYGSNGEHTSFQKMMVQES